jgi:hypothetical protein
MSLRYNFDDVRYYACEKQLRIWIKLQLNFITSIQKYSSSYFQESDRIKAHRDLVDRWV